MADIVDVPPDYSWYTPYDCGDGVRSLPDPSYFVPRICEIMDRLNLPTGAQFQRRWLEGGANRLRGAASDGQGDGWALAIVNVTMDWVLGWQRSRELVDALLLESRILSDNAKALLRSRLEPLLIASHGGLVQFGSYPEGLARESQYINYAALDEPSAYDDLEVDDLAAALGRFTVFAIPIGSAYIDGQGRAIAQIDQVGVYVRDSFDFNEQQPLGKWKVPDGAKVSLDDPVPLKPCCPNDWVTMNNRAYQTYRDRTGRGEDFLVYSDIKVYLRGYRYEWSASDLPYDDPSRGG